MMDTPEKNESELAATHSSNLLQAIERCLHIYREIGKDIAIIIYQS